MQSGAGSYGPSIRVRAYPGYSNGISQDNPCIACGVIRAGVVTLFLSITLSSSHPYHRGSNPFG